MAQQSHELPTNAGPSVPVDINAGLPKIYAGAALGWVPLDRFDPPVRVNGADLKSPKTNGGTIAGEGEMNLTADIPGPGEWDRMEAIMEQERIEEERQRRGIILALRSYERGGLDGDEYDGDPDRDLLDQWALEDAESPEDWGVDMGNDWMEVFVDPVTEDERFQAELANGSADSDGGLPERDREVLARTRLFLDPVQPATDHTENNPTGVIVRTPRPDRHTKRSIRLGQEEDHRHLRLAIASKARDFISLVKASGEKIRKKKPTRRPLLKAWQHVRLDLGQSLRPLRSSGAGVDNLGREANRGEVVRFLRTQEQSQLRQEPLIARTTYQTLEQPLGPRDRSTYFGQFGGR